MPKSQLPPPLQAAIASLDIGKTSEPINMGGAFGVLKVNGKNEGVTPFEDVKDEVKQAVVQGGVTEDRQIFARCRNG